MSRVVVVHGIGNQLEGTHTLHAKLFPALRQGVSFARGDIDEHDVRFSEYGHLFRPEAEVLAPEPYYDADDVQDGWESDFLEQLWLRASEADDRVVSPGTEVLFRTPRLVQQALVAISRSRFWSGVSERAFIGSLKQVSRYFQDGDLRARIQAQVDLSVTEETRVIVGHSLGSVVAYEYLCAVDRSERYMLLTLGSPLGLGHLIFEKLRPTPRGKYENPRGFWPESVHSWTNIVDSGDAVAAVQDLSPLFGRRIKQFEVNNGPHAHDMSPYLTDKVTGQAIRIGLK